MHPPYPCTAFIPAINGGVFCGSFIKINTPLIRMTKAQIIRKGMELGVDYSQTHSCYDPSAEGVACGECDSCILRLKGFRDAGVSDPIEYENHED